MADTNRLFRPDAEKSLRDPRDNNQMNGNIMNPPRYAQVGGLSGPGKSIARNIMRVVPPGGTQRRVPAENKRGD
jgi:hypothetical protein